jgi:hypothetical protein
MNDEVEYEDTLIGGDSEEDVNNSEEEAVDDRDQKLEELRAENEKLLKANAGTLKDLIETRKEFASFKGTQHQQPQMTKEEMEEEEGRLLTNGEYKKLRDQEREYIAQQNRITERQLARATAIAADPEFLAKEKVVLAMAKEDEDVHDDLVYAKNYVNKINRFYKSTDDYIRNIKNKTGKELAQKINTNSNRINIDTGSSKTGKTQIDQSAYEKLSVKERLALPESERMRFLG